MRTLSGPSPGKAWAALHSSSMGLRRRLKKEPPLQDRAVPSQVAICKRGLAELETGRNIFTRIRPLCTYSFHLSGPLERTHAEDGDYIRKEGLPASRSLYDMLRYDLLTSLTCPPASLPALSHLRRSYRHITFGFSSDLAGLSGPVDQYGSDISRLV